MFFKIEALKSFGNFTGKHLSRSLFLKNLQAEGLQLYLKKTPTQVFFPKVCKFFKNTFSTEPQKQLFRNLVMTHNIFFFSTHCLMCKKSNSFVYKFVVNCQDFEITPSECTLWSWRMACLITWAILFETPFIRCLSMCL